MSRPGPASSSATASRQGYRAGKGARHGNGSVPQRTLSPALRAQWRCETPRRGRHRRRRARSGYRGNRRVKRQFPRASSSLLATCRYGRGRSPRRCRGRGPGRAGRAARRAALERLEQARQRRSRDRRTGIDDRKLEAGGAAARGTAIGFDASPWVSALAIRLEASWAMRLRIAGDRRGEREVGDDRAPGPGGAQRSVDDLTRSTGARSVATCCSAPARRPGGPGRSRGHCRSAPPCARRYCASWSGSNGPARPAASCRAAARRPRSRRGDCAGRDRARR